MQGEAEWTKAEDYALMQAASTVGNDWRQAGTLTWAYNNFVLNQIRHVEQRDFPQRAPESLFRRWCTVVNPDLARNQWTQEQNKRLAELYNQYKDHQSKWIKISIELDINQLPVDIQRQAVRLGLCDESEIH